MKNPTTVPITVTKFKSCVIQNKISISIFEFINMLKIQIQNSDISNPKHYDYLLF